MQNPRTCVHKFDLLVNILCQIPYNTQNKIVHLPFTFAEKIQIGQHYGGEWST